MIEIIKYLFKRKPKKAKEPYSPAVTLGWDGLPTIQLEDGTIYLRDAELVINKKYYPDWENEKWPIDPITKKKLPIAKGSELIV